MSSIGFEGIPITNGKLETDFRNESPPIGCGRFGIVVKAVNKKDGQEYAIKKVIIRNVNDFNQKKREIEVWEKITHHNLIEFKSWWVEKFDEKARDEFLKKVVEDLKEHIGITSHWKQEKHLTDFAVLHIQMELCHFSLKEELIRIKTFFKINDKQLLAPLPYYISSELLIEILESIHYLHTLTPPVLHRDIKPQNILIKSGIDGKFVKIGDYGMAVLHEHPELSHTQMMGTIKYMAPEVMTSRYYDTKADVYSIGVMIQELFNFDINFEPPSDISSKYDSLLNFTEKSMSGQRKIRPSCQTILNSRDQWAVDWEAVRTQVEQTIDLSQDFNIQKDFVSYFLKTKYKFNAKH